VTRIFVSYRRQDSEHQVGRICDQLVLHFGKDNVFYDVDTIPVGVNWRKYIEEKVRQCDLLIVPIGDHWLSQLKSRTQNDRDMVRLELEVAIRRNIPIIPLTVAEAPIPDSKELPETIKSLADFNGMPIRSGRDFHHDIHLLIEAIQGLVPAIDVVPTSRMPTQSITEWLVSKELFAARTAEFWAGGGLNSIGASYFNATKSEGKESSVRQIIGMANFFEEHDFPFFKNEVHVGGSSRQTVRITTYRMILTMPDKSVRVFPLKDIHSYTFKGEKGSMRSFFLGTTVRFQGTFGVVDLSSQDLGELSFPTENVIQSLRSLALWSPLPKHVLDSLAKTKGEILGR
jgi:hypothetical protein